MALYSKKDIEITWCVENDNRRSNRCIISWGIQIYYKNGKVQQLLFLFFFDPMIFSRDIFRCLKIKKTLPEYIFSVESQDATKSIVLVTHFVSTIASWLTYWFFMSHNPLFVKLFFRLFGNSYWTVRQSPIYKWVSWPSQFTSRQDDGHYYKRSS